MGTRMFDQYTYLHIASGIVAYFWGVPLLAWLVVHTIFEFVENTEFGINVIDTYFWFWPGGGKHKMADSHANIVGDTVGAVFGWLSSYYLDKLGAKYGYYPIHVKRSIL